MSKNLQLMKTTQLPTKLAPPSMRRALVRRDAIVDRMLGATKLVLVRAPAGFGKTTAIHQARIRYEAEGYACAWLTVDRADNDMPRFVSGLLAALGQIGVDPLPNASPFELVQLLMRHDEPFALLFDDFEHIQEPGVLAVVRELIERLPPAGRLIIGSRSVPELGLARLRARGHLVEIDTDTLRFSADEAQALFSLIHQEGILPETLAQLHNKTEGWAAALWLAAMALERHGEHRDFVERFSGTNRAIADYLAEEVLANQSDDVRSFLLRTSILRQLNASACQALLPRTDCVRILRHLESSDLFLVAVPGQTDSYRYHSLFGDFLRAQLVRELPEQAARLHLSASGWYEAQHRPIPAIDHAIEGGDLPHALHLLSRHAESFLEQGRPRLLERWFAALPPDLLHEHPLLQMVAVWATLLTHGAGPAERLLDGSGCCDSEDAAVAAHVNALKPTLLAMLDRPEQAYVAGRISLGHLPSTRPFADSVLMNAMAHIVLVMGDEQEAQRLLEAARQNAAGSAFNRMYGESLAGMLDMSNGRLRQATARFRIAVNATPHTLSYTYTNGSAWAGVLYAGAVYEAGDLIGADRLLKVYLPLARDVSLPDHMIASHRMRARIAFENGDVDAAFRALTELEYVGLQGQLPRVVASAKLERARLLLLQGYSSAANDELQRADNPTLWDRARKLHQPANELEDMLIGRLRLEVHFGNPRLAILPLAQALEEAVGDKRHYRAMKLRLLLALAKYRDGDITSASELMMEVVRHASREGFVRVVLDEGPEFGPLLLNARQSIQDVIRHEDPIVVDYLQRLLDHLGPLASALTEADPSQSEDSEPLTRKEIRVLQLLVEGYSNRAIAEKLYVSVSTVKTHLRNVNVKLGAVNRTQAVALARRKGIVR